MLHYVGAVRKLFGAAQWCRRKPVQQACIFPDCPAAIVRSAADGRDGAMGHTGSQPPLMDATKKRDKS